MAHYYPEFVLWQGIGMKSAHTLIRTFRLFNIMYDYQT
jgi:hypothetical protein